VVGVAYAQRETSAARGPGWSKNMAKAIAKREAWLRTAWRPFVADDSGNVVVEYILVVAAVVALSVPLLLALSDSINRLMQKIISLLRQIAI